MQSVSSRIWTPIAVSISKDDSHYTTGTSYLLSVIAVLSVQSSEWFKSSLISNSPWLFLYLWEPFKCHQLCVSPFFLFWQDQVCVNFSLSFIFWKRSNGTATSSRWQNLFFFLNYTFFWPGEGVPFV